MMHLSRRWRCTRVIQSAENKKRIKKVDNIIIIIKRLLWRQYPRKIRAQWRNKTKGLGILVTMYNAKSRQPMGGGDIFLFTYI